MKLLIVTQKIDYRDPILGFFHRWVEEFSKRCESVIVITLQEGKHNLPKNVRVLSLGKEKRESRLQYLQRFFSYIIGYRNEYTHIFVHMNQEYVLLGGPLWRLWGKKIFLWRNHRVGNLLTRLSVLLSHFVFCTSPQSFTARFRKTHLMPVGIDTSLFRRNERIHRVPNSILSLGRIAPVKHLEVILEALSDVGKKSPFQASIVGFPSSRDYSEELQRYVKKHDLSSVVRFLPAVSNAQAAEVYNAHEIFINATPGGSFDKTILEAAACESLILVSNAALGSILEDRFVFRENDSRSLAGKLQALFTMSTREKETHGKKLREIALEHNIQNLADKLFTLFHYAR